MEEAFISRALINLGRILQTERSDKYDLFQGEEAGTGIVSIVEIAGIGEEVGVEAIAAIVLVMVKYYAVMMVVWGAVVYIASIVAAVLIVIAVAVAAAVAVIAKETAYTHLGPFPATCEYLEIAQQLLVRLKRSRI